MTLAQFLDMSGYAAYVWPCYGLTFAVLIGMGWVSRRQFAAELTKAKRRAQVAMEES